MKNSDSDSKLKKLLNEMPEDAPSQHEWDTMRENLVRENVIKPKTNRRRFLFFFLALMLISGSYLVYNYQSQTPLFTSTVKDSPKTISDNSVASNNTEETSKISAPAGTEETKSVEQNESKTKPVVQAEKSADVKEKSIDTNPISPAKTTVQQKKSSSYPSKPTVKTDLRYTDSKPRSSREASPITAENQSAKATNESISKESELIAAGNTEQTPQNQTINEQVKPEPQTTSPVSNDVAITREQALVYPPVKDSAATPSEKTEPVVAANIEEKKDTTQPQSTKKRIWVGAYLSGDYNYYEIKNNSSVLTVNPIELPASGSLEGENSFGQFTAGFMGGVQFAKHWMVEAGVFYSQKKKVDSKLLAPASVQNGGDSSQQGYSDYIYHYTAHYLELGGRIKYYPFLINNPYYITGGATASFNFPGSEDARGSFTNVTYSSSAPAQTDVIRMNGASASLSLVMSLGKEIVIGKQWRMFVEPSYKYALDPVIKHPTYDQIPAEHYWRCISIGAGLMYDF